MLNQQCQSTEGKTYIVFLFLNAYDIFLTFWHSVFIYTPTSFDSSSYYNNNNAALDSRCCSWL